MTDDILIKKPPRYDGLQSPRVLKRNQSAASLSLCSIPAVVQLAWARPVSHFYGVEPRRESPGSPREGCLLFHASMYHLRKNSFLFFFCKTSIRRKITRTADLVDSWLRKSIDNFKIFFFSFVPFFSSIHSVHYSLSLYPSLLSLSFLIYLVHAGARCISKPQGEVVQPPAFTWMEWIYHGLTFGCDANRKINLKKIPLLGNKTNLWNALQSVFYVSNNNNNKLSVWLCANIVIVGRPLPHAYAQYSCARRPRWKFPLSRRMRSLPLKVLAHLVVFCTRISRFNNSKKEGVPVCMSWE